jgi:3-hydroxyisobutyrate dehydrogenase-like beta-hydroxyacid dehydrogenase
MAERLLLGGHSLNVYARRPEAKRRFADLGATIVPSLREAAADADFVVVCVLTDEQVLDVSLGPSGLLSSMRPGSVLVIHTTGSPRTAQRLTEAGATRGVDVIDAPVSGTVADAKAGSITLLVGGSDDVVDRSRPLIEAYGEPVLHLGPVGSGQKVKLINNLLLAANVQLASEALRIGEMIGIERGELASSISHCSGATRALGMVASYGSDRVVFDELRHFLGKDVRVATQVAAESEIEIGFLGQVAQNGPAQFGSHE